VTMPRMYGKPCWHGSLTLPLHRGEKRNTKPTASKLSYLAKSHQPKNNHGIDIANPPAAIKITSRLNLRIRLSYSCAQLISPSLTGLRWVAPIHAILMSDKFAPLNQLLLYYSPRVWVVFGYGSIGMGYSSQACPHPGPLRESESFASLSR